MASMAHLIHLQISLSTAFRIHNEKSVGKLSLFPFASLVVNSSIWSMYGILQEDLTVALPNMSGVVVGLYCFISYSKYSASQSFGILAMSVLLVVFAGYLFAQQDVVTLGSLGCILAVILMGSPLASLSTIFRDRSTDSMPFNTSLMTWCNALSWTLYGTVVAHDRMVSVYLLRV